MNGLNAPTKRYRLAEWIQKNCYPRVEEHMTEVKNSIHSFNSRLNQAEEKISDSNTGDLKSSSQKNKKKEE